MAGGAASANPFGDPHEAPGRDELVTRFFSSRGIVLQAAPESSWVPLGGEVAAGAIVVTIRNAGTKELRLVGERTTGIWPFRSTESACAVLHVSATFSTVATGIQTMQDSLVLDRLEDVVVVPGSERSIRLALPAFLPADAECAKVAVGVAIHPLAVVIGGEPERVITLRFPETRFSFGPTAVAAAADADDSALERALAERSQEVVAAAVRRAERDLAGTVDRLILSLPGPDARARRARCTALAWLTGESLGESVERWRGWWESDAGSRFARGQSAAGGERKQ